MPKNWKSRMLLQPSKRKKRPKKLKETLELGAKTTLSHLRDDQTPMTRENKSKKFGSPKKGKKKATKP